jgi:hypothetical protein
MVLHSYASGFESIFLPCDTLIIDGDTIYIEKDEVLLPQDSILPSAPKLGRIPKHFFSAGASFGLNATIPYFELASGEYSLLHDFLGTKRTPAFNMLAYTDLAARFLTIRGPAGNIELSLATSMCLNKVKAAYTSLKNPSQILADSILSFEASEGELLMQYFTVTEPPDIGEVDSLYPQLVQSMLQYSSIETAAKLRATLNRGNNAVRYFLESGIIKRFISLQPSSNNLFLVNESGKWTSIKTEDLQGINMLVPHFAAGAELKLPSSSTTDGSFFTLGAQLNVSIPLSMLSRTSNLSIQTGSVSLAICGRYHF